ncbi:MAG: GHKL domain-containing protein [Oscillospiraceae bacterium]|nr:GHKL domain-containing protein [Oscillospiraceae bacterium]
MITLREISIVWSLLHVLIIFGTLFESRYSRKKTALLTAVFMGPLAVYNSWFFIRFGPELAGQALLLNCAIPSVLFFYILAKHRDGRFLFTFCLVDTVSLEIVYVTGLLDFFLSNETHLVMFVLRLAAFPLLEWVVLRKLRTHYRWMQADLEKGWGGLALVTVLFYLLLWVIYSYPSSVTERLEYLPEVVLVLLLLPMVYVCLFAILGYQEKLYKARTDHQLLEVRAAMMQQRVEQTTQAEQSLAIQRHDLRHRFQTLGAMLEQGELQAAREYIASAEETLQETAVRRWCLNPVLDAVFGSYFRQAEKEGIRIEAEIDLPEEMQVDVVELSTVFANALENAIHAVRSLPEDKRVIRCRCLRRPQLMFRVSNPCAGPVRFDEDGLPLGAGGRPGIGSRSIAAYCDKYGAYCDYRAENGWFCIQIVQP